MSEDNVAVTENKLKTIEASNADVETSLKFKSPAGDVTLEFLDKEFTKIEQWIELKLPDSRYKSLAITFLEYMYPVIRSFIAKALT